MRMMGVDSVEYHEHTVAGRGDDPVIAAAAYYASRGETPMAWGGRGRRLLGLDGEVDLADYRAIFGAGGAHDPRTGTRLVGCRRPGLELVVSPHKIGGRAGGDRPGRGHARRSSTPSATPPWTTWTGWWPSGADGGAEPRWPHRPAG